MPEKLSLRAESFFISSNTFVNGVVVAANLLKQLHYQLTISKQIKDGMLKALIVDDEIDICYLLSSILKQKKLQTSYVNTLREAENFLNTDTPNLLFLDNHLPDGRGIDFIQYIKKVQPDIFVVMITAHDTMEDRNRAYHQGADMFISKPFTREVINNILQQFS